MVKDNGTGELHGASLFAAAASKLARMGSARSMSPSANKYRAPTPPTQSTASLTVSNTDDSMPYTAKPSSPLATQFRRQPSEKTAKSPTKFSIIGSSKTMSEDDTTNQAGSRAVPQAPSKSKLPQKIRSSVTRMRSQLDSVNNNGHVTLGEGADAPKTHHSSMIANGNSSPSAMIIAAAAAFKPRYSRHSQDLQGIRDELGVDRKQSMSRSRRSRASGQHASFLAGDKSDGALVLQFMDLLRPLQSKMLSLRDGDAFSDDDEDEDEADYQFRQHEREHSRVLRICSSLDNLLFAIADQVQEKKLDVVGIATGPARQLVSLIISGIEQIAECIGLPVLDERTHGSPFTGKDERYFHDFLLEVAARWSKLDDFLRDIFTSRLRRVQDELNELKASFDELKEQKAGLELEIFGLREFHANQSATTLVLTSNFVRLADKQQVGTNGPETDTDDTRHEDETLKGYDVEDNRAASGVEQTAAEEIEALKKQCQEYARILEMAKQEIKLSHQERQSQHARIVEMSQSLLKDQEVAQLRNEVQSEKKRVKILEMENLSLRETQVDLSMKVQSLPLNQPGNGRTPSGIKAVARPDDGVVASRILLDTSATIPVVSSDEKGEADVKAIVTSSADVSPSDGGMLAATTPVEQSSAVAFVPKRPAWFYRVLDCCEKTADTEDGLVRSFLSNLLISESDMAIAEAQARLRKKVKVPTQGRPPSVSSRIISASITKKKKKPKPPTAANNPNSVPVFAEDWTSDPLIVIGIRQLIWTIYDQYLMAEEARCIDPRECARARWQVETIPPLSAFVIHYFLERHASEGEAFTSLRRFVSVLTKLRTEYGDIRLFCEFLEDVRGREELHFMLWVIQALDSIAVGVEYDDNVVGAPNARLGKQICSLKAFYLTRMVYRLLNMRSLKKPLASGGKVAVEHKANPVATSSTTGSPRKRRKSRPTSAGSTKSGLQAGQTASTNSLSSTVSEAPRESPSHRESITDRAILMYKRALDSNTGYPLTLEAFNAIVLEFAETPSREELIEHLGGFYQPTGEERKLPQDVFLVLLMETFATQLTWRKAQLQALFVRLAKEEEIEQLLLAKKRQEELDAAVDQEAAAAAKKKARAGSENAKRELKKAKSPGRKRGRRVGIDGNYDKYLTGLSRGRLRNFIVQGGIATSIQETDFDALYVAILESSDQTPAEIHFEQIYGALLRFELLGNDSFAADHSVQHQESDAEKSAEREVSSLQRSNVWRVLSARTIAVTENDPNSLVRRIARQQQRAITSAISDSSNGEHHAVTAMRNFLVFSWRVAARRAYQRRESVDVHSCLSELFYLNQAATVLIGGNTHFASTVDLGQISLPREDNCDPLRDFYDEKLVPRNELPSWTRPAEEDAKTDRGAEYREVRVLLQKYALCFAHLFDSYSSSSSVSGSRSITMDQWIDMASDLGVGQHIALRELDHFFRSSASGSALSVADHADDDSAKIHTTLARSDVVVERAQFMDLLLRTIVQYQVRRQKLDKKTKSNSQHPDCTSLTGIVEAFCRERIIPSAFRRRPSVQEEDYHRRLSCPLVMKALLEHRAFLRSIFYQYAKVRASDSFSEGDQDVVTSISNGESLKESTKSSRNSITLSQFVDFLRDFNLFEKPTRPSTSPFKSTCLQLDESGAAYVFRAVMAIETDDVTRMEFDEFAAAIAAIAMLKNPHPFLVWQAKIHAFVAELRRFTAK